MDKGTRFQRLESSLKAARYGSSAKEVLETCALVAQYAQEHTPDQVKAFQEKVRINPQVWLRLLALHRDERLQKHQEHLPASYTTLYAIHRMSDEEVEAAVQQGVIHPKASSHAILSWSKQNRQRSGNGVPPWRCLMVFDREIEKQEFSIMRFRLNEIAREYGASLMSEWDYIQNDSVSDESKQQVISELEKKILEVSRPFYDRMSDEEKQQAGVIQLENLLHLDITTFGWVTRPDSKTKIGKGRPYTPPYVYKLALQFQMTDSRSQRFNFKRRLRDLAEKQPDLKELIEDVLATYMTA